MPSRTENVEIAILLLGHRGEDVDCFMFRILDRGNIWDRGMIA